VKSIGYVLAAVLAVVILGCSTSRGSRTGPGGTADLGGDSANTRWEKTDNNGSPIALRRLESIRWDSVKHELTWDVSRGERKGEAYQPHASDHFEINMDRATMSVNGETRRFSAEEASNVRTLMDFVSKYALESTVWWESGEGDPVDGSPAPAGPGRNAPAEPNKQDGIRAKAIDISYAN